MIGSLICTGIGLIVGVLMVARLWLHTPPPPYLPPVDQRPAPQPPRLGWIIPGVLPGEVSNRSRGTE